MSKKGSYLHVIAPFCYSFKADSVAIFDGVLIKRIEHLHPHKLRHSFASIAIVNGADIASVSEKLGHADKSTTLRLYTHADQNSIKQASNIFREAIKFQKKA